MHKDISSIKALFDKYDEKNNKYLELKELENLFFDVLVNLGIENPEKRKLDVAKESLDIYNKKNTGRINFNEFIEIIDFLILEKEYKIN